MTAKRSARNLRVAELLNNPANIRDNVGDVTELARAIQQQGVLTPLLVTEDPTHRGWLLLAGHRRLAAAKQAGLLAVPCFIHHDVGTDRAEQVVLMLMENVQRKNLSPVEKAKAYGTLRDKGLTPTEIARRTGIAVSSVHTHLALLDLDDAALEAVEEGELNAGDAIAAVRERRKEARASKGQPQRGRPVVYEPGHLTPRHPLAPYAALACDHSTRPKLGGGACGQCWEATIRADERGEIRHDTPPGGVMTIQSERTPGRWVVRPGGVHVFVGTFPEPDDDALDAYRFTGIPLRERPHPTCGRPGTGRRAHTRHGEPCCDLCNHAEREYGAGRRFVRKQVTS